MSKSAQEKTENFEEAMKKLETVVEVLEKGDQTLESSIESFEEGMRLVKLCDERLAFAERKVEVLMKDKQEETKVEAFDSEDSEENSD